MVRSVIYIITQSRWYRRSRLGSNRFILCPPPSAQGWKSHKPHCNPKSSVKVILLPVDSKEPQLIDLELERKPPKDGRPAYDISVHGLDKLMGPGNQFTSNFAVESDGAEGPSLVEKGYSLIIAYRDAFMIDGSEENQCVADITLGYGRCYESWRGPLVIIKEKRDPKSKTWGRATSYEDISLSDMGPAVKFLLEWGGPRYYG